MQSLGPKEVKHLYAAAREKKNCDFFFFKSYVFRVSAECIPKHSVGSSVGRGWDSTLGCRAFKENVRKLNTTPLALILHFPTFQIDSHSSSLAFALVSEHLI